MWRHELSLVRARGWTGAVAGIDEAGRGPLAGPVVAAAVVLPSNHHLAGLDDSKRLGPAARVRLSEAIMQQARCWAVAECAPCVIDRLNILRATQQAMRQALAEVSRATDLAGVLVDGRPVPDLACDQLAVVGGDGKCPSIAAASVLAKVHRDALMLQLHELYPQYGFAQHKGYPTPAHLAALRRFGPCVVHRRTFRVKGTPLFDHQDQFPSR